MRKARISQLQDFHLPEFDWNHEEFSRDDENIFWVQENYIDSETPLDTFLEILEPSPRSSYERPVISSICTNDSLEILRNDIESVPSTLAAWLDERSKVGGSREGSGPMSARGLYEKLKRKRFEEDHLPDAETRCIYLPDPGTWAVGALVWTASPTFAPIFRDLLWKHLMSRKSFSGTFSPGPFAFKLEFHISYYVWGEGTEIRRDIRKKPNGDPWRSSTNLSFLPRFQGSSGDGGPTDCLYEAQTSLTVSGPNSSIWTACLLTDTYFRDQMDVNDEELLSYHEAAGINDGLYYDPLTSGDIDATVPIWDPREYYCLVLMIRIKRIKEEWFKVNYHLQNRIDAYLQVPGIPRSTDVSSLGSAQGQSRAIDETYHWIKQVTDLLNRFIDTLSQVLESWTWFADGGISHFANGASNKLKLPIQNINTIMETDLHKVLTDLDVLRARLDRFRAEVISLPRGKNKQANRIQFFFS
ncbi:transcription factor sef1 [Colletotrichum graminicola]|nr:transcription factor sef1 [Colletotrichum graminicola]